MRDQPTPAVEVTAAPRPRPGESLGRWPVPLVGAAGPPLVTAGEPPPAAAGEPRPVRTGEPPPVMPGTAGRRRRVLVAAVAVATLGAAAVAGQLWQQQADRADAMTLSLQVVALRPADALDDGHVVLGLRNGGPRAVRVASVRIDFPGYDTASVSRGIAAAGTIGLRLPATPSCALQVPPGGRLRLLVDVRTARGAQHWLMLPLRESGVEALVRDAARSDSRSACR